jgi:hypothetical protein
MSREFTKEELQRIQELTDFCMTRLRPSRDVCSAIACYRLGEEGEQIRELDRIKIDHTWKEGEALQHMRDFAQIAFVSMTEDARCYSEIQNYSLVAGNEEGKSIATKALLVTPDQALEKKGPFVEQATDKGERRQLMRHTEESMRMAERLANTSSQRILDENERLRQHSITREGQIIGLTDRYCNHMIAMATREAERAKIDLEIERMRKREARWDKVMDLGMASVVPKLLGVDVKQQKPTNGTKSESKADPAYVRFINSLNAEQRETMWLALNPEQREVFLEVIASLDAKENEQSPPNNYAQHSGANGANEVNK